MLAELELTGQLLMRMVHAEAIRSRAGKSHLPGRCLYLLLESSVQGGMLERFPKGESVLVNFAKKFWEKLPLRMCRARDLARKPLMDVVLLKADGGEHYQVYCVLW